MALITFLSDFGLTDQYVATVKAELLSLDPQSTIVDISHQVRRFDVAHGAYLLSQSFKEFPLGTVHLVAIDSHGKANVGFIALELEEHFFVGPNNGILSMIAPTAPSAVIELDVDGDKINTFPAKQILSPVVVELANGAKLQKLGKPCSNFVQLIGRKVKATKKLIAGNVIRVDHYGNLITNIQKDTFVKLRLGRPFTIAFGRERTSKLHQNYNYSEEGDCFVVFNDQDLLEIGINTGNAGELLGLDVDSPVTIFFEENVD